MSPHPVLCDLGNQSRQSLVTPIDWKQDIISVVNGVPPQGRQSLVTPIDWKQFTTPLVSPAVEPGRQSLVTPIDWKLLDAGQVFLRAAGGVANPW